MYSDPSFSDAITKCVRFHTDLRIEGGYLLHKARVSRGLRECAAFFSGC